jgi:hypothetical protein
LKRTDLEGYEVTVKVGMGTESNETIATEKIDSMFDERSNMEVLKDGTLCKDAMMKCRIIYLFFELSMKDF